MSAMPMIFATIALINAIGFNITRLKTSELLSTPHIHTSSARLTRLPPLLFALRNNLQTLRQWVHLTHEDVYLHGPFDFATVNGRKTRDRVSIDDWKILLSLRDSYHSTPPSLDLPMYSIHFDRGVTTTFVCKTINAHVQSVASLLQTSGDRMHC